MNYIFIILLLKESHKYYYRIGKNESSVSIFGFINNMVYSSHDYCIQFECENCTKIVINGIDNKLKQTLYYPFNTMIKSDEKYKVIPYCDDFGSYCTHEISLPGNEFIKKYYLIDLVGNSGIFDFNDVFVPGMKKLLVEGNQEIEYVSFWDNGIENKKPFHNYHLISISWIDFNETYFIIAASHPVFGIVPFSKYRFTHDIDLFLSQINIVVSSIDNPLSVFIDEIGQVFVKKRIIIKEPLSRTNISLLDLFGIDDSRLINQSVYFTKKCPKDFYILNETCFLCPSSYVCDGTKIYPKPTMTMTYQKTTRRITRTSQISSPTSSLIDAKSHNSEGNDFLKPILIGTIILSVITLSLVYIRYKADSDGSENSDQVGQTLI